MDGEEKAGRRRERLARAALLMVLYAVPALICLHGARVDDEDLGWHLRTGEWIARHHAVPWVDPFSRGTAEGGAGGEPWIAYSWLFELSLWALHQRWGLVGVLWYSAGMVLAITVATHRLLAEREHDVSKAALLTMAVMLVIVPLYTPRPWLLSVLLFAVELHLLLRARRSGRTRALLWLPALFAVWANVHIQFVDGLAVLALAGAETLWSGWRSSQPQGRKAGRWSAVIVACVAATMVNPYGWRVYSAAYTLASQKGPLAYVREMQAIPFRRFGDYLLLAMMLCAAAALGRRRRLDGFEAMLLAGAAVLAFRSQRDLWLPALVAGAVLAEGSGDQLRRDEETGREVAVAWVLLAAVAVILAGGKAMGIRESTLQASVAPTLPVGAVAETLAKGYAGPLYNTYDWGGYLMWKLRVPVSLDGRAALYGDTRLDAALKTWSGEPGWENDPAFRSARLVIAPIKQPLTQLLRLTPEFRLVYEDEVAAVFVRQSAAATDLR